MDQYVAGCRQCGYIYLVKQNQRIMKKSVFIIVLTVLFSCSDNNDQGKSASSVKQESSFSTDGKKVIVYTTADSTNYRLSATDTLTFKEMGQPFETQPCVFIDPSKTFQSFFGIG